MDSTVEGSSDVSITHSDAVDDRMKVARSQLYESVAFVTKV